MNFNEFPRVTRQNASLTFRNFLIRDLGFTPADAALELEFIAPNGKFVTKPAYMTLRRLGATKTLTRTERASVYASLENAFRHNLT